MKLYDYSKICTINFSIKLPALENAGFVSTGELFGSPVVPEYIIVICTVPRPHHIRNWRWRIATHI